MVARKDAFNIMLEAMKSRANANSIEPDCNPPIAICGPPGSGKTRFLDEVAMLFGDQDKRKAVFDLVNVKEDDRTILTSIFDQLVPITISYGQGSTYQKHYDNGKRGNYPPGLALRILFRLVCTCIHHSPLKGLFWNGRLGFVCS